MRVDHAAAARFALKCAENDAVGQGTIGSAAETGNLAAAYVDVVVALTELDNTLAGLAERLSALGGKLEPLAYVTQLAKGSRP